MDNPDPVARAEALSYKLRKEAFVSNLSGSSLTDINVVTLVAAVSSRYNFRQIELIFVA